MKKKRLYTISIAIILMLIFTACDGAESVDSGENSDSLAAATDTNTTLSGGEEESETHAGKAIVFSEEEIWITEQRFFTEDAVIEIAFPENAHVYYTTDGSEPNTNAKEYTEPIVLEAAEGSFPNCLLLKAKAYYGDGTKSEVVTHTFFAQSTLDERFETVIFSISGEPNELLYGINGTLHDNNVNERGRDSEREIYVEALDSTGSLLFEQGAGVRPYGGVSRGASIKSMKLFARKEYDPEHGKFKMDVFGTIGEDGEVMDKYDKLVLRNYGNDFQFAFIRDELNQRLVEQMGYTGYEAVVPAVVYLNGKYYGLFYLHENYCDDFFKDKFGDGDGSYEVLEGNEHHKSESDDDPENVAAAKEFNQTYNKLAYSDLTNEDNYKQLCEFMDVENYLQYYAYNIYINNNDWPQNNYKCYRYYATEGEKYGKDEQDGRWRFLFHDMDFSMGLYGSDETVASYNNLQHILDEEDDRYSPLFANLMKREDCRQYFIDELNAIMTGPLWSVNVERTLDEMNAERAQEMVYYFEYLESMKEADDSIWIWYEEYLKRTENIKKFAKERKEYMLKFLEEELGAEL